jgi:hypothetical protein
MVAMQKLFGCKHPALNLGEGILGRRNSFIDALVSNILAHSRFCTIAKTIPPIERLAVLSAKNASQRCVLVVIADGFEETDAIVMLSLLRQAGLCVKSVGLTRGLICSAHGVWLMPDLTLNDLDCMTNNTLISVVILPAGRQSLARLEADPRVHRLLRQVVAQRGKIVANYEGLRVLRTAAVWNNGPEEADNGQKMPVLLREPTQSLEVFAQDLIQRLK